MSRLAGTVAEGPSVPPRLKRVLIHPAELAGRIGELGEAIGRDHAGREPLLVGVLTGALIFLADLVRVIMIPLECDVVAVSSYGAGPRSSGVVRIVADLSRPIAGRDVHPGRRDASGQAGPSDCRVLRWLVETPPA